MADLEAQLATKLHQLGCPAQDMSKCMCPGAERVHIVLHLLQMLVQPLSLDQLMARPELQLDASLQSLAPDERNAKKQSMLLTSIGLQATAEEVRGSGSYHDSLRFLFNLANTIIQQQEMRANAVPRPTRSGSPGMHDAQVPTAPSQITGAPATPPHLASSRLLEHVCERVNAMTSDGLVLFPSDVTKACQPFSEQALQLLRNQPELSVALQQGITKLQVQVDGLSRQVHQCSDQEWFSSHQECIVATQHFMPALDQFLAVYDKELSVWCESSERPETHGFGQQAQGMLEVHGRLTELLKNVGEVARMHAAITQSAPPLQGYSRQDMLQRAAQGQQEAQRLAKDLEVLSRSTTRLMAT